MTERELLEQSRDELIQAVNDATGVKSLKDIQDEVMQDVHDVLKKHERHFPNWKNNNISIWTMYDDVENTIKCEIAKTY